MNYILHHKGKKFKSKLEKILDKLYREGYDLAAIIDARRQVYFAKI
jgi:hypothetical protein